MDTFYNSKAFKIMRAVIYTLFISIATLVIDGWISKPQVVYVEKPTPSIVNTAVKTIYVDDDDEIVDITPYMEAGKIIYTVQEGDTFWQLAEEFYQDGNKYEVIMVENGIDNLLPGEEITIPIFDEIQYELS